MRPVKKEIIVVTGSLRRGGAERVISVLTNNLAQRGWKIHILTLLYSQIGYDFDPSIEIIDISNEKCNQLLDSPRLIARIRRIIKEIKPDAVISFMLTINILTWLATRFCKIRFIPSERNDPSVGRNRLYRLLQNFAYGQSSITVFQTERARGYFSEKIRNKSIVIPNPTRVNILKECEPKKRIVSVARLEKQKNQAMMIRAFAIVHMVFPEHVLELFGEGSQKSQLHALINEMGLQDYVILHGNKKDVHELIKDAELFVLSSDYEGMSNALLEAMAMGFPCISTNCCGSDEVIENEKNGVLVPVGDEKAFADAIIALLSNPEKARAYGKEARERMLQFDTEVVVDKWVDVIQGSITYDA